MTKKQKRYLKVDGHKGVYKDSKNNTYLARKKINGKEYSKYFSKISEATHWQRNFHPSIPEGVQSKEVFNISNSREKFTIEVEKKNNIEDFQNGRDYGMSFGDLIRKFYEQKLPSLASSSREVLKWKLKFFSELDSMPLININHFFLDRFMAKKVKEYKIIAAKHRCSFDAELKALRMILNWYRENYDPSFFNPVLQRHRNMGILKSSKTKKKKMKAENILRFFDALEGIWKDLAIFQFFIAGRIQEAAGIQTSSVDFNNRSLLIKDVVVWDRSKAFQELRNVTKNGEIRYVHE